MKTRILSLVVLGGVTAGVAHAQSPAVSEDEARCFVSGICKIQDEKKFSLSNISTTQASQQPARPGVAAPAPARQSVAPARRPMRTASGTARVRRAAPAAAGETRQSLDMRLNFELGSAQLTSAAMAQADVFAKVLKENAGASGRFEIEGHTDSRGSRSLNLDLSRRRAESVVDYLVARGVPAAKLKAVGYGFDRPLKGFAASDPGNRRVEIVRD